MKVELPLAATPATFCIYPWQSLQVRPDGSALLCCKFNSQFSGKLTRDGQPMSVYRHSLDEIWNSDELRAIRRAMTRGEIVPGCMECYQEEGAGVFSFRMYANWNWEQGWLNDDRQTVQDLIAQTVRQDYREPTLPGWIILEMGNRCNLKCRMCNGTSSSRISLDRVQSQWADASPPPPRDEDYWYRRADFIKERLLSRPEEVRHLHLLGGEPFIIKEVGDILQHLIDAGVATNVSLQMTTNATTTRTPWLELTRQFKHFYLTVSVDGFGKFHEYIRYPSRWDKVVENIRKLKELPKVSLTANVTVQAYNVLNLVELLRFLDKIEVPFQLNPLYHPVYLSNSVLPPRARRLAAERLRTYAEGDCRPVNQHVARGTAQALEQVRGEANPALLRDLMLFTNDLDATRDQSFRETCGELLELIEETGFPWTHETLHAGPMALPVVSA